MRGAVIKGWGTALPDKIVTNADLEKYLDTSDEWITERTGIKERHVGGTTSELGLAASRAALVTAGLTAEDIDYVLLCTSTPDKAVPYTAATIENELGVTGGASDLNAACSGFMYGLIHAHGLIAMGLDRVLLVGAETLSRLTDWNDRNTAVLFGDGAGAVILEAVDGPGQMLGWDLGSDGSGRHLLYADLGSHIRMEGREVFRRAVRGMVDSAHRSLSMAGLSASDISLVVPHQANIRIIEAVCERLDVPMERTATVIQSTGNTSAASIPLALTHALETDRINDGDVVLLVGFGAGMSWASAVLRWGGETPR